MRGDPSVIGWLTVVAYGVAAVLAVRASRRSEARLRVFWGLSAVGLAALGANKQLDLQTDLMRATKALATELGLYPDHRRALILTAGALALVLFVASVLLVVGLLEGHLRAMVPAILGWALVLAYVAVRAAFFHHLDEVGFGFVAWTGTVTLELFGITLLGYAALRRPRSGHGGVTGSGGRPRR